jgi:uncharacterized protein (DUF433 family)
MATHTNGQPAIIRTERGLTIEGTRITLYDIMDHLKQEWPPKLIRDWLDISDAQVNAALEYIAQHRDEVEAEYAQVLKEAEEIRQYWEERNRERFAQIAALPPKPGQEAIRAKLKAWKAELESRNHVSD